MAKDIRYRSESRRKHNKNQSLFDRIWKGRQIYPRDQLGFIRINFCEPQNMYETSHWNISPIQPPKSKKVPKRGRFKSWAHVINQISPRTIEKKTKDDDVIQPSQFTNVSLINFPKNFIKEVSSTAEPKKVKVGNLFFIVSLSINFRNSDWTPHKPSNQSWWFSGTHTQGQIKRSKS